MWRDVGEPTDPAGEIPELDDVPRDEGERQEDEAGHGGRHVPGVEQVGERERRYAQREEEDEHVAWKWKSIEIRWWLKQCLKFRDGKDHLLSDLRSKI